MIQLIPKINLSDSSTWVNPAEIICVSSMELARASHYLVEKEYFQTKTIVISGVIPDEVDITYSELLENLPSGNNYIFTTADCATYEDSTAEDREEEIFLMLEENQELFEKYPDQKFIGLLKGVTAEEYKWVYDELKNHCDEFMIYLSGYIRSNPRYFNLPKLLNKILPSGFDKVLWTYGFNEGSLKYLSEIRKKYNIQKAITESYRTKAAYEGNPHYTRKVRIKKAWDKKLEIFQIS